MKILTKRSDKCQSANLAKVRKVLKSYRKRGLTEAIHRLCSVTAGVRKDVISERNDY